jgi:fatty acid-binding protein DegV
MKIKISADAMLDIPQELCARYDFGLVPGTVILGDKEYQDGVDISPQELFDFAETGGATRTAAINVGEYEEKFDAFLQGRDALIHICQSSGISVSYQNACMAAGGRPVHGVDSRNLSSPGSFLALGGA